jgi:hypothetical protein
MAYTAESSFQVSRRIDDNILYKLENEIYDSTQQFYFYQVKNTLLENIDVSVYSLWIPDLI